MLRHGLMCVHRPPEGSRIPHSQTEGGWDTVGGCSQPSCAIWSQVHSKYISLAVFHQGCEHLAESVCPLMVPLCKHQLCWKKGKINSKAKDKTGSCGHIEKNIHRTAVLLSRRVWKRRWEEEGDRGGEDMTHGGGDDKADSLKIAASALPCFFSWCNLIQLSEDVPNYNSEEKGSEEHSRPQKQGGRGKGWHIRGELLNIRLRRHDRVSQGRWFENKTSLPVM